MLILRDSPLLGSRWLRIAPHVVDTVLLASAAGLVVLTGQVPFKQDWLTAKTLALVAYVLFGTVALKRGRSKRVRAAAFALALLIVLYIVSVALTRNPAGFLALL